MNMNLLTMLTTGMLAVCYTALAQAPDVATELNVIYEVDPGNVDWMSTDNTSEISEYPLLGPIFYLPANNLSGTTPFLREVYESVPDHMDSLTSQEGGYTNEVLLGWPWSSSSAYPGLTGIRRYLKGADHGTFTTPPTGYALDAVYQAYGYAREQNATTDVRTLSGSGIAVGSDVVAGGAVSSLIWNGTQFIDSSDYGRYAQADFFSRPGGGTTMLYNPIEAGDEAARVGPLSHGSPLLAFSQTSTTQHTRAIALDFFPQTDFHVDSTQAVIYPNTQIGKDITVNYQSLGTVVQYITHFVLPSAISSPSNTSANTTAEIPTFFLTPSFVNFWEYDAKTQTLTQVTPAMNSCSSGSSLSEIYWHAPSGFGGVIISDASNQHALGIYAALTTTTAHDEYFKLGAFNSTCEPATEQAGIEYVGPLAAGDNAFNSYIVVQSLTNVESLMTQLYNLGTK